MIKLCFTQASKSQRFWRFSSIRIKYINLPATHWRYLMAFFNKSIVWRLNQEYILDSTNSTKAWWSQIQKQYGISERSMTFHNYSAPSVASYFAYFRLAGSWLTKMQNKVFRLIWLKNRKSLAQNHRFRWKLISWNEARGVNCSSAHAFHAAVAAAGSLNASNNIWTKAKTE